VASAERDDRGGRTPPTPAQVRIVDAALVLFSENGVGGTSLQMIADAIGVTKAAVYHQYRTKDEIILAAAEAEIVRLEAVLDAAEAEKNKRQRRETLITGMVDLALESRRTASTILGDPVVARLVAQHDHSRDVIDRLYRLLTEDSGKPEARVPAAMLTAAISGAVMHPLVADVDDETLRPELLKLARRFLDLPR
jgi:AcrR family transcriptional regulator